MQLATVDSSTVPATIDLPREYNAAVEFIDANLAKGRAEKTAFIDTSGGCTYGELAERVNRAGNALRALGARMETRVLMCMLDDIDFPAVFWGAIKAGCVPIPINTLLTSDDYAHLLRDSRARIVVVSDALLDRFAPALADQPHVEHVVVAGGEACDNAQTAEVAGAASRPQAAAASGGPGRHRLAVLLDGASPSLDAAPTTRDDIAFWLYTSGSTGMPKGSMHLHRDLVTTAVHYGVGTLGIREDDLVYSAAKLFFAYGLGNGMTFPFYVGATAVVLAGRPTPDAVMAVLREHRPTIFYGVPTLYGAMLALPADATGDGASRLRLAVSAGEALPAEVGAAWEERFGAPILDGLGSTEMLHIFLSNRSGDVRYGTSGTAVPGYRLKLVAETGEPAARGEIGELWVSGDSSAVAYWNQREKVAGHVPRALDPHRGQVRGGRRGPLPLLRAHRRHAQGRRTVGVAVRGGIRAARARGGARGRRGRRRGRAGPGQAESVRGAARGCRDRRGVRRRAPGVREGPARAVQVSALDRVRRRPAEDGHRKNSAIQAPAVGRVSRQNHQIADNYPGLLDGIIRDAASPM